MAEPQVQRDNGPPPSIAVPRGSDDLEFTCARNVKVSAPKNVMAKFSKTLGDMIGDFADNDMKCEGRLSVPEMDADTVERVVSFCVRRYNFEEADSRGAANPEDLARAEAKSFSDISVEGLIALIKATNYFDIKPLLDGSCREMARRMKGRSPEGIRELFNITEQFTPAEEEEIRQQNPWLQTGD